MTMHYGGDYNPEQWDEATWRDDVARMREAKVTTVSLGIFSWARIQPDEATFDWEWLDTIIELLHANGIGVGLATATASPPAWAVTAYPGILPQDENGATYWHGSRQHYAPTSPDYRRLARRLVTELVARYAQHPAIVMWHVNNEYGCHVALDYSDNAATAFRSWLAAKYTTIAALNAAWGTMFWSQRYGAFDEIVPPRKAPTSLNPGGMLDFRRFSSDALLELFQMERDIIRAGGATQPITTNFMGLFPHADYARWAQEVDFVSDDSYPDPNDPEGFRYSALTRDLMRGLKRGTPWVLMEQASNNVNWRPANAPKAPGQMAALSAQAVARGADGILFFQWRQSRRGSEKFHSAMLPHAGTGTRVWKEIVDLGSTLSELPALPADSGPGDVALVLDWDNWWAISNPDHPVVLDYAALVTRWYSALHRQHLDIDIVRPTDDLTGYRLVVAPQLYLLSDAGAENLTSFVVGGGHLLVTAFSDVVDGEDAFRDGGFTQGLRRVLGAQVEDFGALVPPGTAPGLSEVTVSTPFGDLRGQYLAEELRLSGAAEVVGQYRDGRVPGSPALVSRAHSSGGAAHYLATIPDDAGMRSVTSWAAARAGVAPLITGAPETVEVARRGDVLTVINHGDAAVTLEIPGTRLESDQRTGTITLDPYAWVMVER